MTPSLEGAPWHHTSSKPARYTRGTSRTNTVRSFPPISTSVTYAYESPHATAGDHRYARMSEPTRDALDGLIADLEGGTHGRTFASGMAAINALFTAVLSVDDHVVAGENLYAESHTLLTRVFSAFGVEVTFTDTTDLEAVEEAIRPETALVYLESPTNPLLHVSDIAAIADLAAGSDAESVRLLPRPPWSEDARRPNADPL